MTEVHEPTGLEPVAAKAVLRTPFYFGSQEAPLFAWLHQSESHSRGQRGIVICPPGGHEQVHAHRSLRHLADGLAAAGFPVVRFDYHGTGDSAGVDEDANRHAAWLASLRSAIKWMRDEVGASEIAVVGIRLGAALAVQIAAEEPVAELVLWAPVVKGRAYVREMKALSSAAGVLADGSNPIEPAGFVMTGQTVHDLGAIDLLQIRPQCRRVLIVERDDLPGNAALLDHLRGLDVEAQQIIAPGYADMMAEPHRTKVPHQAIGEIVSWLCGDDSGTQAESPSERTWPVEAFVPCEPGRVLRERAVHLCRQPELFGILSEPTEKPTDGSDLPAVILLNAGSVYRVGPNRLHVLLARRLTAAGFTCLRMDLHGLGDSVIPDLQRENETYPSTVFRDIDLAMKYLQREKGARRLVLIGLCSGAYGAFQSAVQFAEPALVESVLINPLTFYWREGMALESAQSLKFTNYQHSMSSARNPVKWLKLLTGRSKIGFSGAIRVITDRWRLRRAANRQIQGTDGDTEFPSFPAHPSKNDLPADLARIVKSKRPLTFFFARSDPGYDILTFFAKRLVEEMCDSGQMRITFIENADHTFACRGPREALLDGIVGHLSARYRSTVI